MGSALLIHVGAGAVGLVAGFGALAAGKGGSAHRAIGRVFVHAMVPLGLLGTVMAALALPGRPGVGLEATSFVGVLAAYLVVTSLATVRPPSVPTMWSQALAGALIALAFLTLGVAALLSPDGKRDGLPVGIYAAFGLFAVLGAIGDLGVLRSGARRGAMRQARHLWRMCAALLMASFAFFPRMANFALLPEPLRTPLAIALPEILVIGAMTFWLWRTWRGERVARAARRATATRALPAPVTS